MRVSAGVLVGMRAWLFSDRLARQPRVTHEALDQLPASRTREYVRGMLIEHGALPRRGEHLARFTAWTHKALARLP